MTATQGSETIRSRVTSDDDKALDLGQEVARSLPVIGVQIAASKFGGCYTALIQNDLDVPQDVTVLLVAGVPKFGDTYWMLEMGTLVPPPYFAMEDGGGV